MDEATTQSGVAADPMSAWDAAADSLISEPKRQEEAPPQQEAQEEAPQQEVKAEGEKEAPKQENQEQQQEQEKTYNSLDEFLQEQKLDPESFRSLPVTVKIDGKEQQVPLSDVIKSFQLEGHVNNKSIELSNAQKQFQEEQQAFRTLAAQQVQQNQVLGQLAMQQLTAEFQRVDWNTLRATDPAQYAALHADFQQRQAQIQGHLQQVAQQQQQMEQETQKTIQQKVTQERELMLQKNPEWRDPAKFTEALGKMTSYAKQLGFSDAELSQVADHRLMQLLRDAASYQALQAAKPEALKKVRQAPPMAKAGARQTTDPQDAQRQAVFQRLRANPRDMDVQAAAFDIFARMN